MRGKVAKRLRRQADLETIGLPMAVYRWEDNGIILGYCTRRTYKGLKHDYGQRNRMQ